MRTGMLSIAGCIAVFVSASSAQTPAIRADQGVINAAGFGGTNKIAPGSLISIYGTNLASTLAQADSTTLSTSLGEDSVTIGGIKAPLKFVFGTQINAQVPWGVAAGPADVFVTRQGTVSAPYTAQVAVFSPTIYDFNPLNQAIAVNSDATITGPSPNVLGLSARPASVGDRIFFYASGLGPLDKTPPADGVNSIDTLRQTATPLTVKIGSVVAKVDFAGLSPQFTGVYQVNVVIPSGVAPGGNVPLQLSIGGVDSVDPSTIAVQ
jgi:uncharacterized protein (TIGR03437 family)